MGFESSLLLSEGCAGRFRGVRLRLSALTFCRFRERKRFQLLQLLSFAGGQDEGGDFQRRFTLFPIYFQQRSSDPALNYTAFLPFYGNLQNRLFRDEVRFVMFPFYVRTRKKDVVTDNYLLPL